MLSWDTRKICMVISIAQYSVHTLRWHTVGDFRTYRRPVCCDGTRSTSFGRRNCCPRITQSWQKNVACHFLHKHKPTNREVAPATPSASASSACIQVPWVEPELRLMGHVIRWYYIVKNIVWYIQLCILKVGRRGPDHNGTPAIPANAGRGQRGRVDGRGVRAHLRVLA